MIMISSAGLPSAPEPPIHKYTVKWPVGYLLPWDSKMLLTAAWQQRSTHYFQLPIRIVFWASTQTVRLRFSKPAAMTAPTLCSERIVEGPITIPSTVLNAHQLQAASLPANIMASSYANSEKAPVPQPAVARNVSEQIVDSNQSIIGLMVEGHLKAGNQAIQTDLSALRCGVSVTGECIEWATNKSLILELFEVVTLALKAPAARYQ